MSFWGVEVKPGKPFTHNFDRTAGRLRVSQATLGIGDSKSKSLVQCNVGSKSPVFLCALLPNKIESCHLDLEFEEAEDVVFSVLGPRSVHLSGYYVGKTSSAIWNRSDTESYGEDIANTDAELSDQGREDDDYGGSFINDDEDDVMLEEEEEEEKEEEEEDEPMGLLSSPNSRDGHAGNKKGSDKELKKKKYQAVEPLDEINSHESNDEQNCTLPASRNKKPANMCNVVLSEDENIAQESKGEKCHLLPAFENEVHMETANNVTVNIATLSQSGGRDEDCRDTDNSHVEETNTNNSSKDLPANNVDLHMLVPELSGKTSDPVESEPNLAKDPLVGMGSPEHVFADGNKEQLINPDTSQVLKGTEDGQSFVSDVNTGGRSVSIDHLVEVQVENHQKLKRKKESEGDALGECNGSGPGGAVEELKQVEEKDDHRASLDPSACERAENGPKTKKQKKRSMKGGQNDCQDSAPVDAIVEVKQDVQATDRGNDLLPTSETIQVPATIQSLGIDSNDGSQPDRKKTKKKKKTKVEDDGTGSMLEPDRAKDGDYSLPCLTVGDVKQTVEASDMDKDLPAATDKINDPTTQGIDVTSDVVNGSQPEKKPLKKKKTKTKLADDAANSLLELSKSADQCKSSGSDDVAEQIKQVVDAIEMDTSLLPTTEQHGIPTTRMNVESSDVADGFQLVKKQNKNKRKAKVGDEGMNGMPDADMPTNETTLSLNNMDTNPVSNLLRSFPNGLIIEDVVKGRPDGKVATTGKRVKVIYTGVVRDNGHPLTPSALTVKFSLGDEDIIPGWHIGIEGMHVGGKRRLTVPPELGYGSHGLGDLIPPNSWLVYDIELVSVRRGV